MAAQPLDSRIFSCGSFLLRFLNAIEAPIKTCQKMKHEIAAKPVDGRPRSFMFKMRKENGFKGRKKRL
jgi:hypothetical protein